MKTFLDCASKLEACSLAGSAPTTLDEEAPAAMEGGTVGLVVVHTDPTAPTDVDHLQELQTGREIR